MSIQNLEMEPTPRARLVRRTILVVEDEKLVRWSIREALRSDYRVRAAESAEEALKLLPKLKNLEGVLVDIRLPGMDGLSFIDRVRAAWPKVKVFVMTAYNHESAPGTRSASMRMPTLPSRSRWRLCATCWPAISAVLTPGGVR